MMFRSQDRGHVRLLCLLKKKRLRFRIQISKKTIKVKEGICSTCSVLFLRTMERFLDAIAAKVNVSSSIATVSSQEKYARYRVLVKSA